MNNRQYLIGAAVTVVVAAAIWRLIILYNTAPPAPALASRASTSIPTNSNFNNVPARPNNSSVNANSPPTKPNDAGILKRVAIFQEVWAEANGKSLDFYGKVIDQSGQPVVGAKVTGNVMTTEGFQGTKETSQVTRTDGNGYFEFLGLHGQSLGVVPEKEGYQFRQRGNGNWTNDYKADSNNRVIFTMWKIKGSEPMIHTFIEAGLACNGTSRNFDLLTGRRDTGSLTATLTRSPLNIDSRTPFDWTLNLSVIGGGLIEIKDLYPDEAPASGYQTVDISMPAGSKRWTPSVVKSYYFYDGHHYGQVTVNIMANYQPPPTHVEFNTYINPSGSQNLEFDSSEQINP
jgi:hypothetical protein